MTSVLNACIVLTCVTSMINALKNSTRTFFILVLVESGLHYYIFLNRVKVLEESTRTVEYLH